MAVRSGHKSTRALLALGVRFKAGGKHFTVCSPEGAVLRYADGRPIIIPMGGKPHQGIVERVLRELHRQGYGS